nr:5-formyltetrahydrofolate cyclo-ligase, putative [Toxoplasma gondii RH]
MRAGGMGAVSPDRDTDMQFAKEEQGEEGKRPLVVSGYSPIGSELDSTFLLSLAESLGHACALPCIEEKRAPLTFRQWFCGMPLVPGKFNIPAPQPDCRHPVVEPDVVLVPLLGFDRLGRRLGYGGGAQSDHSRSGFSRRSLRDTPQCLSWFVGSRLTVKKSMKFRRKDSTSRWTASSSKMT